MPDLNDKLRGLLERGDLMRGEDWRKEAEAREERRKSGELEVDKFVPGEVVGDDEDGFYLVQQDLPLDTLQGNVELGAVLDAIPEHIALCACDSELETFDPATALFIDTETTGLMGGAGTAVFLVGAGYFTEGAFRLEQCFMRDFDDEEPMLEYLNGIFARSETVVSFNGKSFDVPLLRNRFVSQRMPFRLDTTRHFDLVHAARRFYKTRLGDCSLGNIERAVLGVRRRGDIASAEIPQIWLDYIHTRDAHMLPRVFYHHKMDILSLVALTALLSQCLDVPAGQGFEYVEDRLSLVRLHFRQKRFEEAVACARDLLETDMEVHIRRECLEFLAFAYKRLPDWDSMEQTWELMLQEFPRDILPRLELAKHHEHRTRNLLEAERICVQTLEFLRTREALGRNDEFESLQAQSFQYRLDRIRRKLARARPEDPLL